MKRLYVPLILWMSFPMLIDNAQAMSHQAARGKQNSTPLYILAPENKKPYAAFLADVSPDYKIAGKLGLTRVPYQQHARAIMFVFYMNKKQVKKVDTQFHVILPSKKMLTQQQIVENELPVNFSVANYGDGYASNEWNVALPRKKPREVDICLLWSF